jgi:hypothetical protein
VFAFFDLDMNGLHFYRDLSREELERAATTASGT